MGRCSRFKQSIIFILGSLVYYAANFLLVLVLSITISRLVVLGIQHIGGSGTQIGPGLEAWLVIEILIVLTRISDRALKTKFRGTKLRRLIKKLTIADLILGIFQLLVVIGAIGGIFICYEGTHETRTFAGLNSTEEVDFNNGPVAISNFLNPIRLYVNLFIITYSMFVYICTANTKLSLPQRRKAIKHSSYRSSNWKSDASFAGYLVVNFLQLVVISIFFYYASFGILKLVQNSELTFVGVCIIAIGVGLGFETLRICRKCLGEDLLKPPWFKLENQLNSEYFLQTCLVFPVVALVFFKDISGFVRPQSMDSSETFLTFLTVLALAIFCQTKYLVMEYHLDGEITRANSRFGHTNPVEYRRRRDRIANRTRGLRGQLENLRIDSDRGRRRSRSQSAEGRRNSVESQRQSRSSDPRQENRPALKPSTDRNTINNNPMV